MENQLLILTFLPAAAAFLALLLPKSKERWPFRLAMVVSVAAWLLSVNLFSQFQGSSFSPEFRTDLSWFELGKLPIHLSVGLDGISILLVLLTTLLMPLVFLVAPGHIQERSREFVFWALLMETGMIGVFASLDLVLFYVFWELTLVPLYFIIGIWGGPRKLYATVKFFLYTLAGSLLMLVGVILLLQAAGTADILTLGNMALPSSLQMTCFLLFAAGFAVKVPIFPFHTWLPDAHVEAPTGGSVILAGVLLKMGTYGFLRFCLPIFPQAALAASPYLMALGAFGVVYGAWLAWFQQDLKKLVAYSSVSHMGLIVLGLFAFTTTSVQGSLLQMINHGLTTGALFLLVGMIYERRHTREIGEFGGIAKTMPLFALFFGVVAFASIGLPGLNGFVGEFMILLGSFPKNPWLTALAGTGVVFGALYTLSAMRRVLFGPLRKEENRKLADLVPREFGALIPLVVLMIWIGVAPKTFLRKSEASVNAVVKRIENAREGAK